MKKKRRNQRGVALILVLGSIAIMTVMLTEFQDEATSELSAALADRDALKAEYLAKSGVNLGRLLIASEPIVRQGLSFFFMALGQKPAQVPVWEFSDRILGAFNDKEGTADFAILTGTDLSKGKNLGIEGGRFDVDIIDEDSKLNVNMASRGDPFTQTRLAQQLLALMMGDQYNPMFEQRDRDDNFTDRATVCGALIDWADGDEDMNACDPRTAAPSSRATEDISYQLLKKPYFRKNAAYDSLEELHLVRGVSDVFWSTFIDPDPSNPKKRVVTVWGQGLVNVNTANAMTLWAIVCANAVPTTKACNDPLEAQKFLMGVTLVRSFLGGVPVFGHGSDFTKVMQGQGSGIIGMVLKTLGLEPIQFASVIEANKTLTAESKVFSIYATGEVPGYQRKTRVRLHTVVDFRGAPAPAAAPTLTSPTTPVTPPPRPAPTTPAPASTTPTDALAGALAPNPGGTIVYYRTE
ncbi:MAG TPA: type II secretion system protein GspK [Polyangiaceae bacterium]|nr:type II secretion system protein GspK [Polyangiaceae bacterium]